MGSYNEAYGIIQYKSSLELKAFQYLDLSDKVTKYSIEPFAIKYVKPSTGKVHRYFPDLLIKIGNITFIAEIKSSSETKPPIKPKKQTSKSIRNYKKAMTTYQINQSKWKAAQKFCDERNFKFIILTEKELGITY